MELQEQIDKLTKDLADLTQEFYTNNFSAHQDYNKSVAFNTKLKIPKISLSQACEVGEIGENSGKLYLCSATNVWTEK